MLCPEARVSEHLYGPSVVVTHTTIHALTRGYWPINLARCTLLWRKAGRSLAQSSFFGPDGRSTSYSAPFVRGLRLSAERERESSGGGLPYTVRSSVRPSLEAAPLSSSSSSDRWPEQRPAAPMGDQIVATRVDGEDW